MCLEEAEGLSRRIGRPRNCPMAASRGDREASGRCTALGRSQLLLPRQAQLQCKPGPGGLHGHRLGWRHRGGTGPYSTVCIRCLFRKRKKKQVNLSKGGKPLRNSPAMGHRCPRRPALCHHGARALCHPDRVQPYPHDGFPLPRLPQAH